MPDVTTFYLILGALLFGLGTAGVLMRRNSIVIFMCIELMLNAVNLTIVAVARELGQTDGQVYVLFIMAVAAAEAAVGLAIIMSVFRNYYSISVNDIGELQG